MEEKLKELFKAVRSELEKKYGYAPNLIRIDFDEEKISGLIETKIGKTRYNKHFEMGVADE